MKEKMKIPAGDYHITLEHHPNQRAGTFIATIVDGKYQGKGFAYYAQGASWVPPTMRTIRKGRK